VIVRTHRRPPTHLRRHHSASVGGLSPRRRPIDCGHDTSAIRLRSSVAPPMTMNRSAAGCKRPLVPSRLAGSLLPARAPARVDAELLERFRAPFRGRNRRVSFPTARRPPRQHGLTDAGARRVLGCAPDILTRARLCGGSPARTVRRYFRQIGRSSRAVEVWKRRAGRVRAGTV